MKNNNAFRIMELNQARNKIIINGYEDLSEEEWYELAHLSFELRKLGNNCYSTYKNCHNNKVKKFLFSSNNPVEPY